MSDKKIKKIAISTLGCKVNQFESAAFLSSLEKEGVEIVPFSEEADVYIVNTCAVTAKAASQSRQLVRRAQKNNPGTRVVVTGCYAQVGADEIRSIGDDLIIIGNSHKQDLVREVLCDTRVDAGRSMIGDISCQEEISALEAGSFGDRTRAYLKIQDGCNNFCSYCIVPFARGRSRSQTPERVLKQIGIYAENGYRELVVTGIHTGLYGNDLTPAVDLVSLLRRSITEYPLRYRVSSLEPGEVSEELLTLMAADVNLMPHLHIPLQSGDDRVLESMGRKYRRNDFSELVSHIREMVPDAAIGVDVMVGYPGESEAEFQNTFDLIADSGITYLHVFPYSKRPGTRAAVMKDQIAKQVKSERVARLRDLGERKKRQFYLSQVGNVRSTLVERVGRGSGCMQGFTDNYIPVNFTGTADDENQLVDIRIESVEDTIVNGSRIESREK